MLEEVDRLTNLVDRLWRLSHGEAVTNVVDNAIKYSPESSTIEIGVRSEGGHAWLTVADEGSGIATEHRERIFDRFFRLDGGKPKFASVKHADR
ncbi:MAG TPA: ATP-binding protein [Vicinamibacterales bacterium]|jgi:K+-sensing histidine kinase KdpD|nr:ATP-binding protein [Vicinamibacterales bacterium]